jgi:UDP-glucose 4-epimerase
LLGGDVVHIPKRPGEPDCTLADTERIQRLLGFRTRVSFEDGVQTMLRGLDNWRDAPVWTEHSISQATSEWFRFLGGTAA